MPEAPPAQMALPLWSAPIPSMPSPAPPAQAPARPVVFVYDGAAGEAPPRLAALAEALSGRGRSVRALPASELRSARNGIVVFAGGVGAGPLLRARLAGNRTLVDVRGAPAAVRGFPVLRASSTAPSSATSASRRISTGRAGRAA